MAPDDRIPYGCRTCRDIGLLLDGQREVPCPCCKGWTRQVREDAKEEDALWLCQIEDLYYDPQTDPDLLDEIALWEAR